MKTKVKDGFDPRKVSRSRGLEVGKGPLLVQLGRIWGHGWCDPTARSLDLHKGLNRLFVAFTAKLKISMVLVSLVCVQIREQTTH